MDSLKDRSGLNHHLIFPLLPTLILVTLKYNVNYISLITYNFTNTSPTTLLLFSSIPLSEGFLRIGTVLVERRGREGSQSEGGHDDDRGGVQDEVEAEGGVEVEVKAEVGEGVVVVVGIVLE